MNAVDAACLLVAAYGAWVCDSYPSRPKQQIYGAESLQITTTSTIAPTWDVRYGYATGDGLHTYFRSP